MAEQETLLEWLAREMNITVEELRKQITARIKGWWNDHDPEKPVQWRKVPCVGNMPTPEEWLRYAVEKLQEEKQGDLLSWYPNLYGG